MNSVLETVTGSHLYGLSHGGSDLDLYRVVLAGKTGQVIANNVDTTTVSLNDFQKHVNNGVPQALEALFSRVARYDPAYRPFFVAMRPNLPAARQRYPRTIVACFNMDTNKSRRHALRLAYNLTLLLEHGRFDPTLEPDIAAQLTQLASDKNAAAYQINDYLNFELIKENHANNHPS